MIGGDNTHTIYLSIMFIFAAEKMGRYGRYVILVSMRNYYLITVMNT